MFRAITKEEELNGRRESFARLSPGSLFDIGQLRWFIAIKKVDNEEWEVVELTKDNRQKIMAGQACEVTRLHFNNMDCLNLRGVREV